MNPLWQGFAGVLFLNTLLAGGLAWRTARLRHVAGSREFAATMVAAAVWTFGYGMETLEPSVAAKLFWLHFENLGIVAIHPLWLLFAVAYAGRQEWATRRRMAALGVVPVVTLLMLYTGVGSSLHYAWVRPFSPAGGPLVVGRGPWYFVHIAFAYTLLVTGTVILVRAFRSAEVPLASQAWLLVAAVSLPLAVNAYYMLSALRPDWALPIDLTPLAFGTLGLFFGVGAFRLRLFDVIPLARDTVLESLGDAVLVFDRDERLVDMNTAASAFLERPPSEVVGRTATAVLAPWPALSARVTQPHDVADGLDEVHLPGPSARWLAIRRTVLRDRRGRPAGCAVTLHDTSVRRRNQERLRDLEARWRILLQSSPDAIFICDRDGRILSVNDQAERLFGYAQGELVGREVEVLVPHAQRAAHVGFRGTYLAAPTPRPMGGVTALAGLHRDGRRIPLEIGLTSIETAEGTWIMAIAHDLTSRQQHLGRIRLLSTALEAAASAVAISDPAGVCTWVNPAFTAMTGYGPTDIVGRPLSVLKSGVHDQAFYRDLWDTILAGRPWHGQMVNRHRLGHHYTEEQTIAPVRDEDGRITHFVAIKQDVTLRLRIEADLLAANQRLKQQLEQIEALQAQLHEQAIRDPLTGVFNRRFLAETLEREIARLQRSNLPLAVVLLDVDHFKRVNDTKGHRAGDRVLRALADLLAQHTRREDVVCRYGGEEFVVLMPGAGLDVALARAEAWRAAVETLRLPYEGETLFITISAGVAAFPLNGSDEDALLRAADEALYRAKSGGRNLVTA